MSVIALRGSEGEAIGLRLVSNRDERRDRPEALPPTWREMAGGARAIWPTDPQGGGTWIAASEHGVALTLLNLNRPGAPMGSVSRGVVIPAAIEGTDAESSIEIALRQDLRDLSPFRLVASDVLDGSLRIAELRWDGRAADVLWHAGPAAAFVSSGLGDRVVEPRLGLFERLVSPDTSPEAQDRFHAHAWDPARDAEEDWAASVRMARLGARTVSITVAEIVGSSVEMRTTPVGETAEEWARVRRESMDGEGKPLEALRTVSP